MTTLRSVPAEGPLDLPSAITGAATMRAGNAALLLKLIWGAREISRAELARQTGLSRSTVGAIVAELLETRLVEERGAGTSRGGRRPILIGFDDESYALVGVDLGASHVAVAVTNLRGEVKAWAERPHGVREDPPGTLALVEALVTEALAQAGVGLDACVGLGVGVPSPVDPAHPGALSPLVLPAWRGIDLAGALRTLFERPVLIDNDANVGALAEQWWGDGGPGDLAYIKVGTGVGSGHIIRGQIYRGACGVAGEIGHIAIDRAGPPCVCGLRGCLVTLVGADALLERARQLVAHHPESPLSSGLSLTALADAARDGDPCAAAIVGEAGHHLGTAIASLLNLMNPARVVLGGALTRAGDALLAPLLETIRGRTLAASILDAAITCSTLGQRATAIGAATLVLQAALEDQTLFTRRVA